MTRESRHCPGCGDLMENPHPNRKYCSTACRNWVDSGHTELRTLRDSCVRCGKKFDTFRANKKYCGKTCKAEAAHERSEGHYARRYLREREARLEAAKRYARENPEVGQATKRLRAAALKANGVFRFNGADWKRCCERFGSKCAYCGEAKKLTIDHVVPVSRGGSHGAGNIVPACHSCNSRKRNRFLVEWKAGRSVARSVRG